LKFITYIFGHLELKELKWIDMFNRSKFPVPETSETCEMLRKEPINIEKITFRGLEDLFQKRIFAIPEIQRDFVWTKTKIIDLLDSIKKHYPTGSFLFCKVPAKMAKHIRESTILPPFDSHANKECYIVVDGQQRLSVLYSILYGKRISDTRRYQDGIDFMEICLSPKQEKESEFGFYRKNESSHIKLHDILSGRLKYNVSRSKKRRIEECKNAFENYSFPFILISGYDKQNMREAFIRLNKGGTSLSSEDKIFALSYHKDTDFRRHCDHLLHDLKRGFDNFERKHFIKSIAANLGVKDFVNATSLNTFAKKMRNPRNDLHIKYRKQHKKIFQSIKMAADFLTQRFKHASYLPYPAMLPILSIFYYHNNNRPPTPKQITEIKRWFWATGFTKRYSGSNQRYNQLNDAQEMKNLAGSKKHKMNLEGKTRIEPISIKELVKIRYNKTGAIRNAFFCYLISKEPLNFSNGEPLQIEEVSSVFNVKNDHHIFPKNILRDCFRKDQINTILNICFLTFGENIKAKNRPPWIYLKEFEENSNFGKILKSHVLPYRDCLLKKGNIDEKYEDFKEERTLVIKKDLSKLIGEKYVVN
jgi:hypothetical protein